MVSALYGYSSESSSRPGDKGSIAQVCGGVTEDAAPNENELRELWVYRSAWLAYVDLCDDARAVGVPSSKLLPTVLDLSERVAVLELVAFELSASWRRLLVAF